MPTLVFRGSDGSEQKRELESELTVGREAGNDVVIKDQGVSRKHCRFFMDDDGLVWVEDTGSANGVVVGGERIAEAVEVPEGVEVVAGGCKIKLLPKRASGGRRPGGNGGARPAAGGSRNVSLAKPPVRSTRMMTAAEAPKRARPVARPPPRALDTGRPTLKGLAGPFAGVSFELDKPKLLVGRVPPADVMLDDDSVSRRHAEVIKIGPRFSLRDLGSANGTFLNGDRVSEAPLTPGDVVRFGVVELSFTGPPGAKAKGLSGLPDKKKKMLIIGAAGAVFLLLLIAVIAGGGKKEPAGNNNMIDPGPKPEEDVGRLMGKCRAYSDTEGEMLNWTEAAKACSKVYDLDPTVPDAKKMARQAKKEVEYENLLKEAQKRFNTSQEEEALKILVKMADKESASFPKARKMFNQAAEILGKRSREACKGGVSAGNFESVLGDCKHALELSCNTSEGADAEVLRWYNHACKQSGVKADYTCPPEYAVYQKVAGSFVPEGVDAEKAINAKYAGDSKVAKYMVEYYRVGRPKEVAKYLANMRSRDRNKARELTEIILQLNLIDGRYTTGQGFMLRQQAGDAESVWKDAFEAEEKILPPGVQSTLAKDMHIQLGKEFFKMAKDEFMKDHYERAFKNVYRGYKHDPKNTDLAGAMAQMGRAADTKMNEEPGCESFLWALSITAPDSRTHKKAEEAAKKANCPMDSQ